MAHTPEELEHFSFENQENEEKTPYTKRPLSHIILAWILILIVLFAFLEPAIGWFSMEGLEDETAEVTVYFLFKIGLFTFGGGYAMLPMLQREIVERHGWVTEDEILDYFAVGQCTPGVIAVNTATFVGVKLRGALAVQLPLWQWCCHPF